MDKELVSDTEYVADADADVEQDTDALNELDTVDVRDKVGEPEKELLTDSDVVELVDVDDERLGDWDILRVGVVVFRIYERVIEIEAVGDVDRERESEIETLPEREADNDTEPDLERECVRVSKSVALRENEADDDTDDVELIVKEIEVVSVPLHDAVVDADSELLLVEEEVSEYVSVWESVEE
jgi:hypothetical protein